MRSRLLLLAVATVVACQPAAAPAGLPDADKAAIQAATDSAEARFNAATKDWNAHVAAYYTEDAVVLAPNMPSVSGRQNIAQFMGSFPAPSNVNFTVDEVEGHGDLAYVKGTFEMDFTPPGATAPVHDKGKYLEVWKKQADGSWKVAHDMFNSDLPMAPPPDTTKKG